MSVQIDFKYFKNVIGYQFKNKKLLQQAFTRSSYAHENGGECNEVLEFIGDKVLDLCVIRILLEKYAKLDSNGYLISQKEEGELTKIKSELVNPEYLARIFDMLDLEVYVRYGKSDLNNNVAGTKSVKEDTFEAIIGAIALDSNFDMNTIENMLKKLLKTDSTLKAYKSDNNYVGQVQELAISMGFGSPKYSIEDNLGEDVPLWEATLTIPGFKKETYGYGVKQKDAKKEAALKMLVHLQFYAMKHKNNNNLSKENIHSLINSLVQKDIIKKPKYEFSEEYDNDGNPIWECATTIHELDFIYFGYGATKKESQIESLKKAMKDLRKERLL